MEFTENYRSKWADPDHVHVHRMPHSKISLEILGYQPKGRGYLGRPFKRWYQTTGAEAWKSDYDDLLDRDKTHINADIQPCADKDSNPRSLRWGVTTSELFQLYKRNVSESH